MKNLVHEKCFRVPPRTLKSHSEEYALDLEELSAQVIPFIDQTANTVTQETVNNQLETHTGEAYTFHKQLKGNLFQVLQFLKDNTLTQDRKAAISQKLIDNITECTPGFHIRVEQIVAQQIVPETLDELLMLMRTEIVDKLAYESSIDEDEGSQIHAYNQFFTVVSRTDYGVSPISPNDPYRGQLTDRQINIKLNSRFQRHYTLFGILNGIESQMKSALATMGYIGKNPESLGYEKGEYESFICFFETIIKGESFGIYETFSLNENTDAIEDIQWPCIRKRVFETLKNEGYLRLNPAEEALMDSLFQDGLSREEFQKILLSEPLPDLFDSVDSLLHCLNGFPGLGEEKQQILIQHLFKSFKSSDAIPALSEACDLELIRKLPIQYDADLFKKRDDTDMDSLLMKACRQSAVTKTAFYLSKISQLPPNEQKNILEQTDVYGFTPVMIAAKRNSAALITELKNHNADLNAFDARETYTAAHVAASFGNHGALKALIALGADFNIPNSDSITPLFMAAREGHANIITLLAQNHVDLNAATLEGFPPLFAAAGGGHINAIKAFHEGGADLNVRDPDQFSVLHVAAAEGNIEMLTELLKCGANPNVQSDTGVSPAFTAVYRSNIAVLRVLKEYGADLDLPDHTGMTPLHLAAARGEMALIHELTACGVSLHRADLKGCTPACFAALYEQVEASRYFAEQEPVLYKMDPAVLRELFEDEDALFTDRVEALIQSRSTESEQGDGKISVSPEDFAMIAGNWEIMQIYAEATRKKQEQVVNSVQSVIHKNQDLNQQLNRLTPKEFNLLLAALTRRDNGVISHAYQLVTILRRATRRQGEALLTAFYTQFTVRKPFRNELKNEIAALVPGTGPYMRYLEMIRENEDAFQEMNTALNQYIETVSHELHKGSDISRISFLVNKTGYGKKQHKLDAARWLKSVLSGEQVYQQAEYKKHELFLTRGRLGNLMKSPVIRNLLSASSVMDVSNNNSLRIG